MKIERTKNASRNIFFGLIQKIVNILLPFLMRTFLLYTLGAEYLGLNSLFTSILSFLSLAELGIGTAMVYSMYKPIAEDDTKMICALLNLYKKLYRVIGTIILTLGLVLLPFLKYLVKGDLPPDINLYILYSIYLLNTVISYFMFAYKQSLFLAHQRSDIISKRTTALQITMYIAQFAVLLLFRNYYYYILLIPVITVITNILNYLIANKMYPEYKCEGKVSKEITDSIRRRVLALIGTKINSVVMHAADNIVLSSFLGLTVVALYGNYYYIMNAIIGIMTVIYDSLTAGLGNSLHVHDLEKNYKEFNMLSFINAWIVGFCSICLLCLYQPFMKIWMGEDMMFPMIIVIQLVAYFYIYQIRRMVLTYKDAAGIWWEDRFRPYVMMVVNLILNIVLVQVIGISGVIISTIISMLVSLPWENYTVFKYIFDEKSGKYYLDMFKYLAVTLVAMILTYFVCELLPFEHLINLLLRLVVCLIIPNILFFVCFSKTSQFSQARSLFSNIIKKKLKKI